MKDNKRWKELILELTTLEQPDKEWLGQHLGNLQKEKIFLFGKELETTLINIRDYLTNYMISNNIENLELFKIRNEEGKLKWENEKEVLEYFKKDKEFKEYIKETVASPKVLVKEKNYSIELFKSLGLNIIKEPNTYSFRKLTEKDKMEIEQKTKVQKYETKTLKRLDKKEQQVL